MFYMNLTNPKHSKLFLQNQKDVAENGLNNIQNGKDLTNNQLQGDQRKGNVTCEYWNN